MLLGNNDIVDISVLYKQQGSSYLVYTKEELADELKDLAKKRDSDLLSQEEKETIASKQKSLQEDKFEKLNIKMKALTWGDYNRFQDNATQTLPDGERRFSYKVYKEERLKNLILSWDIKDDNGMDVQFTPNLLSRLPYQIGEAIIRAFDEVTYYDEEKEKN